MAIIRARHRDRCRHCGEEIQRGALIAFDQTGPHHAGCVGRSADAKPKRGAPPLRTAVQVRIPCDCREAIELPVLSGMGDHLMRYPCRCGAWWEARYHADFPTLIDWAMVQAAQPEPAAVLRAS